MHGQVSNEIVLGHVLRIARAESGMPAVSKVQLNPALRPPTSSKPQEVLHREAFEALRKGFPTQIPSITITTRADGEIVLKGTIATYEDRLAVSRHLREATACSSILNQLRVLAEPQQGLTQNSSRPADASSPGHEHLNLGPVQPVTHVPDPESTRAQPMASANSTDQAVAAKAQPATEKPRWPRSSGCAPTSSSWTS